VLQRPFNVFKVVDTGIIDNASWWISYTVCEIMRRKSRVYPPQSRRSDWYSGNWHKKFGLKNETPWDWATQRWKNTYSLRSDAWTSVAQRLHISMPLQRVTPANLGTVCR